jgi:hypothetical protein
MLPFPVDPSDHADPPPSGPVDRPHAFASRRPPYAPGPGMLLLRIAIMALGLTIGIVLLTRGDLVLGVLLVAFAGLRLAVFVSMRRRRHQWRSAREGFRHRA